MLNEPKVGFYINSEFAFFVRGYNSGWNATTWEIYNHTGDLLSAGDWDYNLANNSTIVQNMELVSFSEESSAYAILMDQEL